MGSKTAILNVGYRSDNCRKIALIPTEQFSLEREQQIGGTRRKKTHGSTADNVAEAMAMMMDSQRAYSGGNGIGTGSPAPTEFAADYLGAAKSAGSVSRGERMAVGAIGAR